MFRPENTMKRRTVLASVLFLAACATQPAPETPPDAGFMSDRISVVSRGEGPDVIFIPGMTSHRDVWAATADALDDRYSVHLVQVNGFAGFPAGGNVDGPVAAPVAEEIARYIAEAGLERPAVIGHSMGGTIGMMLAARHPDAIGKLMVVDMFPFMGAMFGGPGATAESVRPVADQMRAQMLSAPPGAAEFSLDGMIASMTQTESARPIILQHARASDRRVIANSFHELITTDLRPELPNIAAPLTVLYVVPPNTPVPPAQYEQFFHLSFAGAPQARVIKVEQSRHFIMIDQPERFLRETETFLAG
jgi:pimeloyl-ACP methyl ester carboxylesterase